MFIGVGLVVCNIDVNVGSDVNCSIIYIVMGGFDCLY